jgi:hypothetical protein
LKNASIDFHVKQRDLLKGRSLCFVTHLERACNAPCNALILK